jgi:hypothetical protein
MLPEAAGAVKQSQHDLTGRRKGISQIQRPIADLSGLCTKTGRGLIDPRPVPKTKAVSGRCGAATVFSPLNESVRLN